MQSHYRVSRVLAAPVLVVAIAVLAACSSSSSPASGSSPTSAAPATSAAAPTPAGSPGSGSAATGQITTNWEAFFNGSTSADKKISLLQNGQAFASLIRAQAGLSMAQSASAKVLSVTVNSTGTQASVKYNVLLGGTTALPNQSGTAIYQGGVWKVGDASFCSLIALEYSGKQVPQVCSSVG